MKAVIDYETRSRVDLKARGSFVYAEDLSTEVMCLSVSVDDGPTRLWIPDYFKKLISVAALKYKLITKEETINILQKADRIVAHNSMFEYLMNNVVLKRQGWPTIPLDKFEDTMAQCAYHALPLNLDQAAKVLDLPIKKDETGHKIMLQLCKPNKNGEFIENPVKLTALFNYCGNDTDTERLLHNSLRPLPDFERAIWLLDQKINLRGVPIDIENVRHIVRVVEERTKELLNKFQSIVGDEVSGPRSYVALKNWVNAQCGTNYTSLAADIVKDILKGDTIPDNVREVLKIKAEISKASTAKFKAMLECVNKDNRMRGMFQYGAASTLRWGGRKVQLHNLPRDSYKPDRWEDIAKLFAVNDIEMMQLLYDEVFPVASRCIRGAIKVPNGKDFICSDFSSIEAIGNAYLAGEQESLEDFKNQVDSYKKAASKIFNKSIDSISDKERQVGKVSDLALGYGGGIGAYASMAKGYNVDLEILPPYVMPNATYEELDGQYGAIALAKMYIKKNPGIMSLEAAVACDVIKRKWRAAHPAITASWKSYEGAARSAIEDPGTIYTAGRIKYLCNEGFLKCLMPSGRIMHYYQPSIHGKPTEWDDESTSISYWGLKVAEGKTTRQWTRLFTYGGKLCENIVQGFCRDLLAFAMLRLDPYFPIVLHVHDEACAEVPKGTGDLEKFNNLMTALPSWACGMPVNAKGWIGERYRK